MDQNFQTSFIPKRSLSEETPTRTSSVSIYLFISVVFLLASLAGAGLVTFYKSSLTKQVAQMRDDLKKAEGAFEGDFIQDLQTIDRRIIASNEVLSNHIAVTPIFEALQIATLKSIQFTKFSYDITGTGAGAKIAVQMSGRAPSYKAIALESDQ